MYKALHISPMIPSYDMKETISFFQNILEFKIHMDTETYAILYKDDLTLHILPAGYEIGEMEFYMEVDDIDKVWNSMKEKLVGIKHREPFDREYGMREVHIEIPQTETLMFIGQQIK
ncbi:MAG TPA: hypothetical protein PKD83_14590 [Ignavibacteria bacterium]|nr:hypothetical protein [Ignavibacteria bacterium]